MAAPVTHLVVVGVDGAGRTHRLKEIAVTARQNLAILHNPSWKPDGRGPSAAEPRRR